MSYTTEINESYETTNSIHIPAAPRSEGDFEAGTAFVRYDLPDHDEAKSVKGNFNSNGLLTGLGKVYADFGLEAGDELEFELKKDDEDKQLVELLNVELFIEEREPDTAGGAERTLAESEGFNYIHLSDFRPENVGEWEPENETDVYMAFGNLEEYSGYRYCCGASRSVLENLGYDVENRTKPDAILIDRATQKYLISEWKVRASDFSNNHDPGDVDLLVCWEDDEDDRNNLPDTVLVLKEIAREAGKANLKAEEE